MTLEPQCFTCKHLRAGLKCKAFDFIPNDILEGKHDHTKEYKGDNGIRYEEVDDSRDNS